MPRPKPRSGFFKQIDLFRFPNRGREFEANQFLFFASPETSEKENAAANSGFAQRYGLVERSNSEPGGPLLFQSPRALDGAMTIRVGLNDSADGYVPTDVLLNCPEIFS